jgi:uncharacterized repeat protein (TIGR01451 family)
MTTNNKNKKTKTTHEQERAMNDNTGAHRFTRSGSFTTSALALLLAMAGSMSAYAAVTNSVTVTGTGPTGPAGSVTSTANESVDLEDDAPAVAVVRAFTFAPGPGTGGDVNGNGLVDAGDQIVYTYTVTNSGNVTLKDVEVSDVHDGTGAALAFVTPTSVTTDAGSAPAGTLNDSSNVGATNDGDWDILGPDDVIVFSSTPYTVTPGDLAAPTSTDRDIDGTVTASGDYDPGSAPVTVNGTSSSPVPLNIVPSLVVTKEADQTTNVAAGTLVTYTYRVRNTGTVPVTAITLTDTHKGVVNGLVPTFSSWITDTASSNTGNTIDILAPGDEAEFTATYTVTQADVDTLQ